MGLRKIEAEEEFDAPPETMYKLWTKTPHLVPEMTQYKIQSVELHNGDNWEDHSHGSVKTWKYLYEGKIETFKEKVEFDEANLKVTHVGLDGTVFKYYKTASVIWQFKPKGNGTLACITVEYEKISDDMPDPIGYVNNMVEYHKAIDAHLKKA